MGEQRVRQFKDKYETLAGIVHLVADTRQAVQVVATILKEIGAGRIAMGEMPEELQQAIETQCERDGIGVLKPPFQRAQLPQAIDQAAAGISMAAFAIAETGTLVEFTTNDATRLVSTLPRVHIGVCRAEDIVETLKDSAAPLRDFYMENPEDAVVTFISGPSRTGDIEMRLTLGVHGPEVAHAVVLV